MFKLSNSAIRLAMAASLVMSFALYPFHAFIARYVGQWYLTVSTIVSLPFIILNLYWMAFPQSYLKFIDWMLGRSLKAMAKLGF